MTDPNTYPPGWDNDRVRRVLEYYENQSEEEAALEDETALDATAQTVMVIPNEFVPAVRALISKQ